MQLFYMYMNHLKKNNTQKMQTHNQNALKYIWQVKTYFPSKRKSLHELNCVRYADNYVM